MVINAWDGAPSSQTPAYSRTHHISLIPEPFRAFSYVQYSFARESKYWKKIKVLEEIRSLSETTKIINNRQC